MDAEHLLAHSLGKPRLQLYLEFDRPLTSDELAAFKPLLLRRAAREPLQYIVGRTGFRELELRTDARALIPRPETEVLVEVVLLPAASVSVALTTKSPLRLFKAPAGRSTLHTPLGPTVAV